MQVKKQQLEQNMEQQTGSKLGKEYIKAINCHPACLTCMQNISCEMPGWMNHKLESRSPNVNNLRYADDTTLMAENEKELKRLLIRVKEESEKAGLKLNIHKTKIVQLVPSFHGKQMGKKWKWWQILFSWVPKSMWTVIAAMKLKDACFLKGKL